MILFCASKDSFYRFLQHLLFDTVIPSSIRLEECSKAGESIYLYDGKGKAAVAFENLVQEVIECGR